MTIELAGPGAPVTAVETHTADVLLTGSYVLKIKKPVRFAFLDYTTREQRLEACRREVALNQRLAPDVYLGVADIAGPDGQPWDHAVVMRRLPADRSLDHLIAEQRLAPEAIGAIARQLASFHASARRGPDIDAAAGSAGVRQLWVDNLTELRDLVVRAAGSAPMTPEVVDPARLEQIGALAEGYLAGRETLWGERLAAGAACDGHGDLQAADIFWLDDGPRILDCIEFDDRYRFADVVADLAFLAMDLERLGAPEAARRLVDEYMAATAEPVPPTLLDHYVGYRALVRAKVAAIRAVQETDPTAAAAYRRQALDLVELCLAHLRRAQVLLVVVGGAPGTGKTTLARDLEAGLRADGREVRSFHSDVIRKELAGVPPRPLEAVDLDAGLYRPELTERTYEAMVARARDLLVRGTSVVLDASWSAASHRLAARRLGLEVHAPVVELDCRLDAATAARRIEARAARGDDASDATPELARALASRADAWPEAAPVPTAGSPAETLDRAMALVTREIL